MLFIELNCPSSKDGLGCQITAQVTLTVATGISWVTGAHPECD